MKILVINAGSSSIKYQLIDLESVERNAVLASGLVEKIGEPVGRIVHKTYAGGAEKKHTEERPLPTHNEGMARVVELLTDPAEGVVKDASEIAGVGHRVLNCGEVYSDTVRIDAKVKEDLNKPKEEKVTKPLKELKQKPKYNIKKLENEISLMEDILADKRALRYEPEYYQDMKKMAELDDEIDEIHNQIHALEEKWEEAMLYEEEKNK
jgi:acetate kinase